MPAPRPQPHPRKAPIPAQRVYPVQSPERAQAHLAAIVASSPVAICSGSPTGVIETWNKAAEQLFGYPAEEIIGRHASHLVPPDKLAEQQAMHRRMRGGGSPESLRTQRVHKQGHIIEVCLHFAALWDAQAHFLGISVVARDASVLQHHAQLVERHRQDKETLLREINHRVKNNLQVISSMLYLQSRQVTDSKLRALFTECQARVMTLAVLHEKLLLHAHAAQVRLGDYLAEVVRHLHAGSGAAADIHVRCQGDEEVMLPLDAAMPCGLIVGELVSNSLKHGTAGKLLTQIDIAYGCSQHEVHITVADNGAGLPPHLDPAASPTLGLALVQSLTRQIAGSVQFARRGGTECRLSFPSPSPHLPSDSQAHAAGP